MKSISGLYVRPVLWGYESLDGSATLLDNARVYEEPGEGLIPLFQAILRVEYEGLTRGYENFLSLAKQSMERIYQESDSLKGKIESELHRVSIITEK